ncbi:hypothetical protein O3P69_015596 [Scylla paramamosain]|uniref:HAT C-terminal dimerisation domain-containing protein n=1 Tax=Scylla paramamosain TaxID=85552 RepID=A0AAW0SAX4_SCYPA
MTYPRDLDSMMMKPAVSLQPPHSHNQHLGYQKQFTLCRAVKMGKWAKYGKKYKKEWEKEDGLREWISGVPGDDSVAACKILEQYDELKLHFEISKDEEEKNYTADLLYQMYSDPANKLYLAFLQPVVSQVNRVNKLFESDRCNANRLLEDLMSLYKSILQRLMMPRTFCTWKAVADYDVNDERNHLPLEAVDFGVKFYIELGQSRLDSGIVHTVKKHGRDFLMKLLQELQQRLPSNINHLQSLDALTPETVLGVRKPRLQELSFLPKYSGDIGKLDGQWQRLATVSWPKDVINDSEKFWLTVHSHQDASGERDFKEVGQFALSMLSLPISNASVERVFSQMNLIKNKLRNRMQHKSLENTLHVRAFMNRNNMCCREFDPTQEMLSMFTKDIYTNVDEHEYVEVPDV